VCEAARAGPGLGWIASPVPSMELRRRGSQSRVGRWGRGLKKGAEIVERGVSSMCGRRLGTRGQVAASLLREGIRERVRCKSRMEIERSHTKVSSRFIDLGSRPVASPIAQPTCNSISNPCEKVTGLQDYGLPRHRQK